MNDLLHASTFFLIFAAALALYAAVLAKTGDKNLLPYRAQHSVRSAADVKRVGRISLIVALVVAALALVLRIAATI